MELKQTIWNLSGSILSSLIVFSLPLLTKYLGLYEYGIFAVAVTFCNFIVGGTIGSLGYLVQEKYIFVDSKENSKLDQFYY